MSASDGSSNAVNDAIIRLYLYGNDEGLSNYLNELRLRQNSGDTILISPILLGTTPLFAPL